MNNIINEMIKRRSIKKYKPDEIPENILEKIVKAGTYAPTGRNMQAPIILCVTNKEIRDKLSRINAEILGVESDPFYGAPAVCVVLADKSVRTHCYDGTLVLSNMMLAAHSLGLGSCWIHRAKETFETEEGKALLKELGIEGEYEGIGNCIIGYPDGEIPKARPRKENYVYYIR